MKGFTLVETLTVIFIIIVMILISVYAFVSLQKKSGLDATVEQLINVIRTAQSRTLASEGASQYGVYFESSQYTLFKGSDYGSRDPSFDKVYEISLEIYDINLIDSQVVYDRLTGLSNSGDVSLRLVQDNNINTTIYIEGSGRVSESVPSVPVNSRAVDSRHIHFTYTRNIGLTETLRLNFSGVTEDIVIGDNLREGEFYWEGQVDVSGDIQEVKIHTHGLNNPNTLFSVHRDYRYNNKPLIITLSSDPSYIIGYNLDGSTSYESIYTENLSWQ